jgi:hypothetical protein
VGWCNVDVEYRLASRRWLILGLGLTAQTASCAFLYGIPFLVPAMRAAEGSRWRRRAPWSPRRASASSSP